MTTKLSRIKATPIKAIDLQPGDLFSVKGQAYWDGIKSMRSVGEAVYLRTYSDSNVAPDSQSVVHKIELEYVDE